MRAFEFLREEEVSAEGQASFKMPGTDKEVTITVPVTVNMPAGAGGGGSGGGGSNHTIAAPASDELPDEPLFISPMQQQLELLKQQGGKQSTVINQIVRSDNGPDTDPSDGVFADEDDGEDRAPEQSVYAANALDTGWDEEGDSDRMSGTGDEGESGDTGPDEDESRIIDLIRKLAGR
jgi:hypothetical protein